MDSIVNEFYDQRVRHELKFLERKAKKVRAQKRRNARRARRTRKW